MESIFYPQFKNKVLVKCNTYNHSKYIKDALNGFAIQKTTFPFICLVTDDCSTDGAQQVIKSWIDKECDVFRAQYIEVEMSNIVVVPHKINHNCTFAFYFLKQNLFKKTIKKELFNVWAEKSKYIATCEGDDYWIHPDKLQRQIEFLEAHPNHSLCFHAHRSLRSDGTKRDCFRYKEDVVDCPMSDMILGGGGFMATASMVYVRELGDDLPEWARKAPIGDAPLMLVLAERGKVGYIHEVMSCYRVAATGSWTVRISQDRKKRKQLHKGMVLWIKGFDLWTNKAYHPYVRKALYKLKVHYYLKAVPLVPKIIEYYRIKKNSYYRCSVF